MSGLLGCAPQAAQPNTISPAAQADRFQVRLLDALDAHRDSAITEQAVLGEGAGAWDPAPRRPEGTATPLLWLHDILAAAYVDGDEQRGEVRDALRYYDGQIAFSHRKHFTDRWLALEPGPLQPIRTCEPDQRIELALPLESLQKKRGYGCPLHESARTTVSLRYFSPRGAALCADRLPEGSYVMFSVVDGKRAKGQRHPAVLTIAAGEPSVTAPDGRDVVTRGIGSYTDQDGASGYTLYRLDPSWLPPEIHDARPAERLRCGD